MGTQNELAKRYGPQTTQIEALLDRVRNLTDEEAEALSDAVRFADPDFWGAWNATQIAAWDAARTAGRDAARDAAWVAAWNAAGDAAWEAIWDAVQALLVRDLVGQHGFTQEHYDTLVALWESVMGTEWTRETL